MSVDPEAVGDELERILGSDTFVTAGRHNRLLRYLVERTLAGEGEQLKEYVLGIDVFDRADSYDPRIDSIVRVEVRRLRSRMEDYYRGAGAADPVVISIPRGSYVPVFSARVNRAAVAQPAPVEAPPHRGALSPATIITAALSLAIVIVAANLWPTSNRTPARASSGPGIAVLPFEHFSTSDQESRLVARLTDAVTTAMARLGTVSVRSRTSAAQAAERSQSVIEMARALNVDFVIEASVVFRPPGMRVAVRLVDGQLDRKVWVGEYQLNLDEIDAVAARIAADAANAAIR